MASALLFTHKVLVRCVLALFLLTLGFSSVGYAQDEKIPEGYKLEGGRIYVKTDAFADYYLSYGRGGSMNLGLENNAELLQALNHFVPIPVLVGTQFSREQSLKAFSRSVVFNLTGSDPMGQYLPENSNSGNVELPIWVKQFASNASGLETLYNYQLLLGNYLIVEDATQIPLYIYVSKGGDDTPLLSQYWNTLEHWSAAYPWLFYELQNVALKESIADRKDLSGLRLFANHRLLLQDFMLDVASQSLAPAKN
jgi:hypothetical protein